MAYNPNNPNPWDDEVDNLPQRAGGVSTPNPPATQTATIQPGASAPPTHQAQAAPHYAQGGAQVHQAGANAPSAQMSQPGAPFDPNNFQMPQDPSTLPPSLQGGGQHGPSFPAEGIGVPIEGGGGVQPPNWYDAWWEAAQGIGQGDPGDRLAQLSPELQAAYRRALQGTGGPVSNFRIEELPEDVRARLEHGADVTQGWLDTPGRYDTELFQGLLDTGLSRLGSEAEQDRLRTLRDAANRLGPQSGQLTNEFIDLAAEQDRHRNELMMQLAREGATTQAQDRLAAAQAHGAYTGDLADAHYWHQGTQLQGNIARQQAADAAAARQLQALGIGAGLEMNMGQMQRQSELDRLMALQGFGQMDIGLQDRAREDYWTGQQFDLNWADFYRQQWLAQQQAAQRWAELYGNMPGQVGGDRLPAGTTGVHRGGSTAIDPYMGTGGGWGGDNYQEFF